MKKENWLWIILKSIFLIIFNVVFFTLGGFDRKVSVWISYGFIHFAYFMLLLTPQLIRGKKSWTELGFPLYSISSTYFIAEFFIGVIFILLSLNGHTAALLIQLFLAGLYGTALLTYMIANEYTVAAEEERLSQISFIKEASVKIKGLLERINDKEAKKKVERVYDTIYSSPVKSHPDLALAENRILQSIRALEDAIYAENKDSIIELARLLEATIKERNEQLKH
jgi:signal transduction histidine kinase